MASSVTVSAVTSEPVRPDTGFRWLDLVGTRLNWPATSSPAVETLPDAEALAGWLAEHGLGPEATPTATEFALVRQVRAALRELAVARVHGRTSHPQALDTVNAALAKAARVPRPVVVPDPIEPGYLRRRLPDVDAALLLIIEEAVDTMAGRDAVHLHECEEPGCGTLFFDPSGRRRWCSGQACGTRARVRAHRERRKAAASQAVG
jgi:predicted RNA-binding Zn ribbon-like protein